jgi:hypothetical protein
MISQRRLRNLLLIQLLRQMHVVHVQCILTNLFSLKHCFESLIWIQILNPSLVCCSSLLHHWRLISISFFKQFTNNFLFISLSLIIDLRVHQISHLFILLLQLNNHFLEVLILFKQSLTMLLEFVDQGMRVIEL